MTKKYLESMILQELTDNHRGRENAILCKYLINLIGVPATPEEVRKAVNSLRKNGFMIGSASTTKPHGYYMITTPEELDNFIQQELGSRLADLSQTISAMGKTKYKVFGKEVQMGFEVLR